MKILLIYPEIPTTFWSFKHVLGLMAKRAVFPPLGLLTVAAMLPRDWELRLVDLNVESLTDQHLDWADYVLLSAMLVQKPSAERIIRRVAARGKPLIAGGPMFTTSHAQFPEVGHFVLGEAEDVMPELVRDMEAGTLRRYYRAPGRPDLRRVPVPRWDLINLRHYVTMAVQFSRGCPFDCEFCDIIVMNGRRPRTKTPAQLIGELDALRERGWKGQVFIVDDNFIGNRARTKELLQELIAWRKKTGTRMGFLTEASVNLADDPELCQLMVEAGFHKVFVGLETPCLESLTECHKLQNQRTDLEQAVRTIQRAGMEVMGGFVVGFDHDRQDIFKRQFEFIQRSGVVTAMVGLLTALPETRLYQRLKREGRIVAESDGSSTALNFVPRLDREFLLSGYRELMRRLYEPRTYYRRIRTFLEHYRPVGPRLRVSLNDLFAFLKSLWVLGVRERGRRAYWRFFWSTLLFRPRQFPRAIELVILGYHFRALGSSL